MKIITPKFEIINQNPELVGLYKQIEWAGRHCYNSLDKITDDSYIEFIEKLIQKGHTSVLEHGTVYLKCEFDNYNGYNTTNTDAYHLWDKYKNDKYSKCKQIQYIPGIPSGYVAISTNYRVLVENGWEKDLKYLCEPTPYHEKRITVHFTTQVAISREFNRHRVNSMVEQSTRYCSFDKDRFGGEININRPFWITPEEYELNRKNSPDLTNLGDYCEAILYRNDEDMFCDIDYWLFANLACEYSYMNLIRLGRTAQEARTVLPLDLNTELIHTAFISDWNHFFDLRCATSAHPDARNLAVSLKEEFETLKYL